MSKRNGTVAFLRRHRLLSALVAGALALLLWMALRHSMGVAVELVSPRRQEMLHQVVTTGRVRPRRVQLASAVSGAVQETLVDEGARVIEGQLLLQMDDRELAAAVQQAEAGLAAAQATRKQLRTITRKESDENLAQAEARLEDATRDLERIGQLVESGVLGRENLEEARTAQTLASSAQRGALAQRQALNSTGASTLGAQARVQQAEAALALAQARLAYARVKAPVDGFVLSRNVEQGDVISASTVVLELAASSETELVVEPDERNLSLLKVGQRAIASAEAFSDQSFDAVVSFIAPAVDRHRGTIEVRLRVAEPPSYLRPDMTVSVNIEVGRKEDALVVPIGSVADLATAPYLLVLEEDRAVRRPVEIGIRDAVWAEVTKGLSGAERIVADPTSVEPGQRIRDEE